MHLKLKRYYLGVLLIYAITTLTLPSVGRCEPSVHSSQTNSHPALRHDSSRVLTSGQRLQLDSRSGGESRHLQHFDNFKNRDSGGPELRIDFTAAEKSFKNRNNPKRSGGERRSASANPVNEGCSRGEVEPVTPGRFYISGQLEANPVGYQADSAVSVKEKVRGQRLGGSEESWQRLQPVVECGDDAMTLTVRRRRAVQLQLDRVNESAVPLSLLPPQCGYSVQTTWKDLSLMAQYDACHVTQEDDGYVLPLLWRGTPVKMSCPASQIQPEALNIISSLCCSSHGLTVKVQGIYAAEEPRVNVRGEWTPLMELAERCGYTLDRGDADMVIAAPYVTCGITVKDGKHTLSLQIGGRTFTLSCPVRPPDEPTHQPLVHSLHHLTGEPAEQLPLPWAPPFYLAPPYYPHPTYHHKYLNPDGHDAYNPPPAPSSQTPEPLPPVDPQSDYQDYHPHQIPSVRESYKHHGVHSSLSSTEDMEDSGQVYPDLGQKQEAPVLVVSEQHRAELSPSSDSGFPIQVEPPFQPPSYAFNPYYHYYHHPKIPQPSPPQDPDPGPEVHREQSLTNPHNPEYPQLSASVQQSGVNSHQVLQPVPEAASHPDTLPTSPPETSPNPPQPHPHHYSFYFPHIARGEAKRVARLDPDTAAKVNLSDDQNSKSSTFVQPRSSHVHDGYKLNPYTDLRHPDDVSQYDYDDEDDEEEEEGDFVTPAVHLPLPPSSPPEPAAVSAPPAPLLTPSPNHNLPPHPRYPHPYYHYYQMHYGPEGLLDNLAFAPSSEDALDPPPQASTSPPQHPSYVKHQTTTPPENPAYDAQNAPLHPYYYYYYLLYHPPAVTAHNQEMQPAGSVNSDEASKSESLPPSEYSGAAEGSYHSIPQPLHGSFHSLNSHYVTQQHVHDRFGPPGGEEAEETELEKEMKDHLEAIPSTPSASPCSLGSASDSHSLGCCLYPVKDCTVGQHMVFVVPESLVEPTVAPAARPSELSNVTCALQKMTSDPDVYAVPLEGCGVNKQVFGDTVVHQLEVHGVHASVRDNSPVRLMVECSSSPGSPGEERLHLMDDPPPPPVQASPATPTVQLRIATDQSFTSFHPDTHLPLSLMRGRLVYVEVSLLDPPEPGLVLLVHSCLAYIQAPYASWMPVYDGCLVWGDSQLLPSPRSDLHHIWRIVISGFLFLPSESPSYMTKGGNSHLDDPEIYFMCLAEVCSAADSDCTVGCINSPQTDA